MCYFYGIIVNRWLFHTAKLRKVSVCMQLQQKSKYHFNIHKSFSQEKFNEAMAQLIGGTDKIYCGITILCIGSDRLIGDCFGPLTGHMLAGCVPPGVRLFGTLEKPVHALSIREAIESIDVSNSLVIAVDSSVGSDDSIGCISLSTGPVRPGSGLGKELPEVGDIAVTGVTASCLSPFTSLQNAPLGLIYKMAEHTFAALRYALETEIC